MSYIFKKIQDNIRKYGILKTLKRAYLKLSHLTIEKILNILCKKKYKKELDNILNLNNYKNIIIQFPFFDFNMPNFQRFQQIAIALGQLQDNLFLYCSPNNIYDSVYGFYNISNNLYVTNQYKLLIECKDIKRTIIFVSTDLKFSLEDIDKALERGDNVIYDYVDEIHEDIVGKISKEIINRHKNILKDERIRVIVTADKLENEVKLYRNKNYENIGNGVKIEDFAINQQEKEKFYETDKNIKKVNQFCNNYKVNILYYGVFAKWFDYELICNVAKDKNIGIILIGPDYDLSLRKANILEQDNVMYIGMVNYKNLKYFANLADILTIPFVINDITNATSPVKLFEYMSMGKPILTTELLECKKYKSVTIATSYNDFIEKIYLLKNNTDDAMRQKALEEARENSWENKCKNFLN